jgi:ankyrin repeat protein
MDIQWLVDHGVDVKKASVIFYAVKCNRLDMVKALIKCGAKLDVVVKEGSFTHTNNGVTLAHAAAQCGDLEMVKFLADNGVDFNAVDSKGNAPIHAASKYGNVQILEYLLDRGADVNGKNNDDETPLDIAEKESMEDAVEILKEYQKKKQAAETIQD